MGSAALADRQEWAALLLKLLCLSQVKQSQFSARDNKVQKEIYMSKVDCDGMSRLEAGNNKTSHSQRFLNFIPVEMAPRRDSQCGLSLHLPLLSYVLE